MAATKKTGEKVRFYCYVLLDTRKPGDFDYGGKLKFKFEPFYVGKGSGNRSRAHIARALRGAKRQPLRINKIRKILREGYEVRIRKTEKVTEVEAFALEMDFISKIGRKDLGTGPLCNLSEGGEGPTKSAATCEKLRLANLGRVHTQATKDKISRSKTNPSEEIRRNISRASAGRKFSPEVVARRNASIKASRTPEVRARISAALKGVPKPPRSAEYCANMSRAKRNISEETREKMRLAKLGNKNRLGGKKFKAKQK